jgi:polyhydroxyalkanoate synthesis regulator phasin
MLEFIKKTMLAGVGIAVVTKDKILEVFDEMVNKGEMTRDEAIEMTEKIVNEGKEETEKAKIEASKLFNDMLHKANIVTKEQHEALLKRVKALEGRLHKEFPNED